MKNLVAMIMVTAFLLTTGLTSFAATQYTTTPKSSEVLLMMSQDLYAARVLYDDVKYVVTQNNIFYIYTSDWGMVALKTTQAYAVLVPKKNVPSDIYTGQYTYNMITQKFTKIVKVVAPVVKAVVPVVAPVVKVVVPVVAPVVKVVVPVVAPVVKK